VTTLKHTDVIFIWTQQVSNECNMDSDESTNSEYGLKVGVDVSQA